MGSLVGVDFETAIGLWEEGARRLRFAEPDERLVMERVADRLVDELRRRLGGSFTTDELAALYSADGTDWCLDVALAVVPGRPTRLGRADDRQRGVRALRARGGATGPADAGRWRRTTRRPRTATDAEAVAAP